MPRPDPRKRRRGRVRDQSVFDEPSLTGASESDAVREARALRAIDREALNDSIEDEAQRSVFDEPSSQSDFVSRPANALDYATLYRERSALTTTAYSTLVTVALALVSGPAAIIGAFMGGFGAATPTAVGSFAIVVVGPILEEVLKTTAIAITIDRRPWLFLSRAQILAIGVVSGFAFAFVENLIYLTVYVQQPSAALATWRWTVCVALHVGCSLIASLGFARVWASSNAEATKPRLETATPFVIAAIVIHGVYNAVALALEFTGVF